MGEREDLKTVRCHEPVEPPLNGGRQRLCMNKTKDPSGKCWRHR